FGGGHIGGFGGGHIGGFGGGGHIGGFGGGPFGGFGGGPVWGVRGRRPSGVGGPRAPPARASGGAPAARPAGPSPLGRAGRGAGVGARCIGVSSRVRSFTGSQFSGRSFVGQRAGVSVARVSGGRFATAPARTLAGPGIRTVNLGRGVFGNRAIANAAFRS